MSHEVHPIGQGACDLEPARQSIHDRIIGYDLARALAIFGMILVHFPLVMSLGNWRPKWLASIVDFLDGRAAATFVVLAGVGVTLRARGALADAARLASLRSTLTKRGLFLLAVGFLNLIIWSGDILRVYGVTLLLAAWLISASDRRLWAACLFFALGFVVLILILDYEKSWHWETLTYHNLWTAAGCIRNLFFDGFRTVFPWSGLLFFGMWLGRRDLANPRIARHALACGLGTTVIVELVSRLLITYLLKHPHGMDQETITALVGTKSMPPMPLFLLSAVGFAVAVISSSLMIAAAFDNRLVRSLVATGQMAFTWYVGHIVIGIGALMQLGFEEHYALPWSVLAAWGFFGIVAVVSYFWRSRVGRGPLEWLTRRVAG